MGARTNAAMGMAVAWLLMPALLTPVLLMPGLVHAQQGTAGASPPGPASANTAPQSPSATATQTTISPGAPGGGLQVTPEARDPKQETLNKTAGGLIFLPLLKPTDGVLELAPNLSATLQPERGADAEATLLDRAAAVISGEVILESDVREQQHFAVFEPYRVPGGRYTPLEAMQQILNRTLLLHQMKEQRLVPEPTDAAVEEQIADVRKHIPACAGQSCETEEGWRRFLAAQGFTEAAFHERWKSRMQILNFVEVRFRTGIRIAKPEIEKYYREQLVPQFAARKVTPPPLEKVSQRIDEVLLQQHVNVLLSDYLRSLKDAGSVQILDPAYNELGKTAASSGNSNPDRTDPAGGEQ